MRIFWSAYMPRYITLCPTTARSDFESPTYNPIETDTKDFLH